MLHKLNIPSSRKSQNILVPVQLDKKELTKFLTCSIIGLCKFIGAPAPSRIGISTFTYEQFKIVDEDGSGSVEYSEFESWIDGSDEIQTFLLRYTGVCTFRIAQKRFVKER